MTKWAPLDQMNWIIVSNFMPILSFHSFENVIRFTSWKADAVWEEDHVSLEGDSRQGCSEGESGETSFRACRGSGNWGIQESCRDICPHRRVERFLSWYWALRSFWEVILRLLHLYRFFTPIRRLKQVKELPRLSKVQESVHRGRYMLPFHYPRTPHSLSPVQTPPEVGDSEGPIGGIRTACCSRPIGDFHHQQAHCWYFVPVIINFWSYHNQSEISLIKQLIHIKSLLIRLIKNIKQLFSDLLRRLRYLSCITIIISTTLVNTLRMRLKDTSSAIKPASRLFQHINQISPNYIHAPFKDFFFQERKWILLWYDLHNCVYCCFTALFKLICIILVCYKWRL